MKNICIACIPLLFLLGACASKPDTPEALPVPPTVEQNTQNPQIEPIPETQGTETSQKEEVVAQFDTVKITKQTFENTKTEMQIVVEKLNKITMERDYTSWLEWLSDEYYRTYSDPAVLEGVSASLPIKNVKIRNINDYFNYVFVPSRQNMRVDDIQFISPTRVYVIMEITPKSPAAIYILEKTNKGWKLVPKNQ